MREVLGGLLASQRNRLERLRRDPYEFGKSESAIKLGAAIIEAVGREDENKDVTECLQALEVLTEHAGILFTPSGAGTAFNRLISLSMGHALPSLFRVQIFVTATSIAVIFDFFSIAPDALSRLTGELLAVIGVLNGTDPCLRHGVAQCLLELEASFPGLLAPKLGHFLELCAEEKTFAAEGLVTVLAISLHHAVARVIGADAIPDGHGLDTLVRTDIEGLTPYQLSPLSAPSPIPPATVSAQVTDGVSAVDVSTVEITRAVSFLANCLTELTPASVLVVIEATAEVVKLVGMNPKVFSHVFKWLISMANPVLLRALVGLELRFGMALFDPDERAQLWLQLQSNASDPSFTPDQRVLLLSWVRSCGTPMKGLGADDTLRRCVPFLPVVFDTPEVMASKLECMCDVLCWASPSAVEQSSRKRSTGGGRTRLISESADVADAVFVGAAGGASVGYDLEEPRMNLARIVMGTMICFADAPYRQRNDKVVLSLYHTLFTLYCQQFPGGITLREEVYDYVLRMALRSPRFLPNAVDLGECIKKRFPNDAAHGGRSFLLSLLDELKAVFVMSSDAELRRYQSENMWLLERLAVDSADWQTGDAVLRVCAALMYNHRTAVILRPLGDLLLLLSESYGSLAVRDHAGFYYTLLTNVSGEQLLAILRPVAQATDRDSNMQGLMASNLMVSTAYPLSKPIQKYPAAFLRLERCKEGIGSSSTTAAPDDSVTETTAERYMAALAAHPDAGLIAIKLQLCSARPEELPDGTVPPAIYGVQIIFGADTRLHSVPRIGVPVLQCDPPLDPPPTVMLTVRPKVPMPVEMEVRVEFNEIDGHGHTSELLPFKLSFADMLQPLGVPGGGALRPADSSALFESLWLCLSAEAAREDLRVPHAIESVTKLEAPRDEAVDAIFSKLEAFLVGDEVEASGALDGAAPVDGFRVGMRVIPSEHALIRGTFTDMHLQLRILTDAWRSLPFIEALFKRVLPDISPKSATFDPLL